MPAREGDWAAQTADTIERVIGSVRGKTSEPVERFARVVVYGLVAAFLGTAAVVLLAILIVRVLDVTIPGEVWPAHLIAGGIFTVLGLFLWRKRRVKKIPAKS